MAKKKVKKRKAAKKVKKNENAKLCAILSYLLIGIIWYFVDDTMKKDAYVRFHVKQGLVLLIFWIAWSILLNILMMATFFLFGILSLLSFVPLIFAIIGIVNAANDKKTELPVIGTYAKKLSF